MKLAAEPGDDAQAQALDAVTAYTQTFNKMGFIETEERDEIYMALRGILDALPGDMLQKDTLIEKFDGLMMNGEIFMMHSHCPKFIWMTQIPALAFTFMVFWALPYFLWQS